MTMKDISELNEDLSNLEEWIAGLPPQIGNTYLNFFLDRFKEQGWRDAGLLKRWKERTTKGKNKPGPSILIQSGRLKRSLRMRPKGDRIIFSTDVPYAKVHNEGGLIKKNIRVRSHVRRQRGKRTKVREHNRKVNTEMPQRQYMGRSGLADQRIIKQLERPLQKIFN